MVVCVSAKQDVLHPLQDYLLSTWTASDNISSSDKVPIHNREVILEMLRRLNINGRLCIKDSRISA